MKLLHAADFHLDSPFQGFTPEQQESLRKASLELPFAVARLCREKECQMLLLSGDLFDGPYTRKSYEALASALEEAKVSVIIAPGNHDHVGRNSPWLSEHWPENVHIFTTSSLQSRVFEDLDCRVYGAGYTAMDCPGLLQSFTASGQERYHIGVLHGDPTAPDSPYCPITRSQVENSGLTYLALGHIHKGGSFRAGNTLCAWPGCPMGRGYDEPGQKGVLFVDLDTASQAEFVPLMGFPKFYTQELPLLESPEAALSALLPGAPTKDFYRITLTGQWETPDLAALSRKFSHIPNLTLRDATTPPVDPWGSAGEDSLEGTYFRLLQEKLPGADPHTQEIIQLAARISRQLLDGQEVKLP